jgi:histidinol phosphatase-like PHP family hydrolase
VPKGTGAHGELTNAEIAELLARAAEKARMPLQKALRRASRKAFFWEEEASRLVHQGRALTELPGVGPHLNRIILGWIENPPAIPRSPEIRNRFLALTKARAVVATRPDWVKSLKGDLQMHSSWSDGSASIAQMAEAAAARDYQYIAITDHTKGLKIAGGIDEAQLLEQAAEIDALNNQFASSGQSIRVLRSVELNLDPEGRGDMDSQCLRHLDIVLGSFHSALRRKDDQTERYLAALRNADIQILGHPRGRIYNYRLGLTADWSRVFDYAALLDKAVEIDGYPDRQDLSLDLVKLAKQAGCRISLGTDAHDETQLRFIELSLASAILAGVKRERILNFMAREELLNWVSTVREAEQGRGRRVQRPTVASRKEIGKRSPSQ